MPEILSTYRVQLTAEFGFAEAAALVPYWSRLGVTHLYLSPILKAAPASTHGYDVVDPTEIDPKLGGAAGHAHLTQVLRDHGMGQVVDVVPNHMAIAGRANPWWWDVLRKGRKSPYAAYFDIDWSLPEGRLHNRIVLPVLGDHYGRVLDRHELRVDRASDEFVVRYFDNEFPVDPDTIDIDADIDALNASADRLDELICAQNYRLAYWRVAGEELDYRRFFDVDSLVALRAERSDVYRATHPVIKQWLADGTVDGLRIDHVDGLRDPAGYLQRLRDDAPGDTWIGVEKILEPQEHLPVTWPVQGTTGYDTLGLIDGLFVNPEVQESFTQIYQQFTGNADDYRQVMRDSKAHVVKNVLGSDVERLTDLLVEVCEKRRSLRDYTRSQCRLVLEQLLVAFPVYRTYVEPARSQIATADVAHVDAAVAEVGDTGLVDGDLLSAVRDILCLDATGTAEADLLHRFQQLSGPVMAKGVEDTAFYRYARFVAGNEVGNQPDRWSTRADDLHEVSSANEKTWPKSLNTSSTHDTKRSEDTRHRLAVLTEMPNEWASAVQEWARINDKHKRPADTDGASWPDTNMEYMFYQAMVGAYPLTTERALDYVRKASKEAKRQTSWTTPNSAYDAALESFVRSACSDKQFLDQLEVFVARTKTAGRVNSLAAATVKLTMPGVPDTYQGCETWNHSLVDPDNRRAVDYSTRQSMLEDLSDEAFVIPELATDDDGYSKMLVVTRCLGLRNRRPEAFGDGSTYRPVYSSGTRAGHVIAFERNREVLVVVPRLTHLLDGQWEDTCLTVPPGEWSNIFTSETVSGGSHDLSHLLQSFPVAVLDRQVR